MNNLILKIGEEEYTIPLYKFDDDPEKSIKNACSEIVSEYYFTHKIGRHSV